MPNESVNLYIAIQSGNSERTLTSLADKTRALDKETQLFQQTTEALAKANKTLVEQQTKLQAELKSSQKTVNDLQKTYDEYDDELIKLSLDNAIENHAKLKEELLEVNAQIGANQKTYKEYLETVRKGSLSGGQGSDSSLGGLLSSSSDFTKSHLYSELAKPLVSAGGALGEALLTSMIGTPGASLVSDTLSNAISGAVAGSILGPGGAVAGAVLGGLTGLVTGGTKIFEEKDDAFKEYYGGLYQDVSGRSGEMVSSGSTIAGGREQTHMAFAQRLGGDAEANDYLARVEKMAASTNYDYDEITGYTKLLLNSYDPDEVFDVLQKLSDATAGLDLSSSDVNMMISGLSRMRTTGKATQEYLNYFRERGVDVDQALADSLGVEKSSISGMVTKGKIGGEDAAEAILDFIQKEFGGLSDTLAGTYDAMVDNLGDIQASLQASGGDAYNERRKEGIQAEKDAYEGELGDAIKEINAVIGENQARKENLQDQYMREVLDAVLNGNQGSLWSAFTEDQQNTLMKMSEQYASLMEQYQDGDTDAGAMLESLYEQAQVLGQEYFDNSGEVARLNDIELDEIEAIRQNTVGLENAYTALYNLNQTMSKGLVVKGNYLGGWELQADGTYKPPSSFIAMESSSSGSFFGMSTVASELARFESSRPGSHAFGLDRVPYNDYPALLHEGERVLTASEARAQDAAPAPPIQLTITGNSFSGTSEEMADQMWEIIMRKLEQAYAAAAPK